MIRLIVVGSAVDVVLYLINGIALKVLWGWFIVPFFHQPPLSLPIAIGIIVVIWLLTNHSSLHSKDDVIDQMVDAIVGGLYTPAFALLVGWVTHLFI